MLLTGFLSDIVVGAAGVDLFFVISGFVMVYASEAIFGQPRCPALFPGSPARAHRAALLGDDAVLLRLYLGGARAQLPTDSCRPGFVRRSCSCHIRRTDGIMAPGACARLDAELRDVLLRGVRRHASVLPRRAAVLSIARALRRAGVRRRAIAAARAIQFLARPDHPRILLRHADRLRLSRGRPAAARGCLRAARRAARRLCDPDRGRLYPAVALRRMGPAERRAGCGLRAVGARSPHDGPSRASSRFSAMPPIRSIWCTRSHFRCCGAASCRSSPWIAPRRAPVRRRDPPG